MRSRSELTLALGAALTLGAGAVLAQQTGYGGPYDYGTPATEEEIAAWNINVPPDGANLPTGSGTHAAGQELYAQLCSSCHGAALEGVSNADLPQGGGAALIGGRGTLNTDSPKMTVESYWPYATTLYDYIHRAMPYTSPSSLQPDEVYSLVAFILGEAEIIDPAQVIDATTLPQVEMPNRDGFFLDDRPERVVYD
jgi:cytochrome c